jgi:hypothetical protein
VVTKLTTWKWWCRELRLLVYDLKKITAARDGGGGGDGDEAGESGVGECREQALRDGLRIALCQRSGVCGSFFARAEGPYRARAVEKLAECQDVVARIAEKAAKEEGPVNVLATAFRRKWWQARQDFMER